MYHIIKAKSQKKQKNFDEALKTLTVAMNLPGMRRACMLTNKLVFLFLYFLWFAPPLVLMAYFYSS